MEWKRIVDAVLAGLALLLLLPLFAVIGLVVYLDSGRPVLYSQWRVGRGFARFRLWKFRTMTQEPGLPITVGVDRRITRAGRVLRTAKLDEFPQFWNVLLGEMSIVGPRPELPEYVDAFHERYRKILTVRPGITDLASLQFRDEAALLAGAADPMAEYVSHILPTKLDLAAEYVSKRSFLLDVSIVVRTVLVLVRVCSAKTLRV